MLEAIFSPKVRPKKKKPRRPEAEAPASAAAAPSERTRPPPSVRIADAELTPDVERPSGSHRADEPARERDSEPPPPLRPRALPVEDSGAHSVKLPRTTGATPLRTPLTLAAKTRPGESRLSPRGDDDELEDKDEDASDPKGGRS
jgi:hypothetical protein